MNATHAMGWALVHFLWQGAALAIVLGIALTLTRATAARTRYTLSLLTLSAMLVAPMATGLRLHRSERATPPSVGTSDLLRSNVVTPRATDPESPALPSVSPATSMLDQPVESAPSVARLRGLLTPVLPWLVVAWVVGVVLLSIRLAHGWITARRLRTLGTYPTEQSLQQVLARLAARMRVTRPVQLLESLLVDVPAVLGWLRPVILVPASALTGLTPQQLEVLLAHELAHVRRYDYLVNVAQCVIETLLFYHPAVWWVSRRVREEREHCCDDLVVQVCGDRHLYASALVNMERLRSATPRLALAATGGALLSRVRRLLVPSPRVELFPRWAAAAAGVVAVTIALLATRSDQLTAEPTESPAATADTARTAPDTVLRHPDPTQPLSQRWEWARTQARQLGKRNYWIGYQISRPEWLEHSVYFDRGTEVIGQNITISGRLFGDFQGLMFRGVRLAPLTGSSDSDDIAILFSVSSDQGGKVTHVHVASMYLPVDFRGRTLVWLGRASDAQSLPLIEGLFAATAQPDLRQDMVAAVGIHGTSDAVVPILNRWLNSKEPTDVRSQAAEWLGFHPSAAAVVALSRAARSDPARDVRREAAEGLGDNTLPAATDSAIAVARTATDRDARREAVEGLGQKDGDRALAALVALAQSDPDVDVQREAVETLGEVSDGRGLSAVRDIARKHSRSDVRREAVETLGENLKATDAIPTLKVIATEDPSPDVQREAIETLSQLHEGGSEALAALTEFARTHPNSDVRRAAIETLGQLAPTAETVRLLSTIAGSDHNEDVQRRAVETLGEIGDLGLPAVINIARTHPSSDVRRTAIETIGEHAPPAQALDLLGQIARRDPNPDVQRKAVEALGALNNDRAYRLLVEFARTHPVTDVRRKAIETLGETGRTDSVIAVLSDVARGAEDPDIAREAIETLGDMHDARAFTVVARIARAPGDVDVRRKAIETYAQAASPDSALALLKGVLAGDAPEDVYSRVLEELEGMDGGAGIPALIDAARSHPNREVRADALRRLAESDDPRAQKVFDQTLRRP